MTSSSVVDNNNTIEIVIHCALGNSIDNINSWIAKEIEDIEDNFVT